MREAFKYMFNDNCFFKKALVYFLLAFLWMTFSGLVDLNSCSGGCPLAQSPTVNPVLKQSVIYYSILYLFFVILGAGYYITALEGIKKQEKNIVLPFFNFKLNLLKGLKLFASILVTVFIFYIFVMLYIILSMVLPWFNVNVINIFFIVVLLLYAILSSSFLNIYAENNEFWSFFNFKKAFYNIKENPKNYFKYLAILFITYVVGSIFMLLFEYLFTIFDNIYIVMILSNIVSAFIATYIGFASLYLIAKSVKQSSVV